MKFLVVEDDEINNALICEILKRDEANVVESVSNGSLAIEKVESAIDSGDSFDVVLLDIMMPGVDGHDVLKAIRSYEECAGVTIDKRIVIIMVSALVDRDNIFSSFREQADGFLCKPVVRTELEAEIEKLTSRKII